MEIRHYADSQAFFEISSQAQLGEFNSLKTRILCLRDFLKKLLLLPFALVLKLLKTFFRVLGAFIGAGLLFVTLGTSPNARDYFVQRVAALSKDVADWILLPFAIIACFSRLVIAFLVHPSVYFNR